MRSHPPLRLTRRGKAVLWILGLSLVLLLGVAVVVGLVAPATRAAASRSACAGCGELATPPPRAEISPGSPAVPGERVVVVRPGDTLWSIVAEHAPSRDPYGIIEKVRRRNDLVGHRIHAGQELVVP